MPDGGMLKATGRCWCGCLVLLWAAELPADEARDSVYGIWASSGTMIEVTAAGDSLSARIIALKNPNWREKDGVGVVGEPKTDLHNPDASLRGRSLLGLEMLRNFEFRNGRWRGHLYLPTNGTTWKSTAFVKDGTLRIRGYVGISILGKTQKFAPLASCNENILKMIEVAELTAACKLAPQVLRILHLPISLKGSVRRESQSRVPRKRHSRR